MTRTREVSAVSALIAAATFVAAGAVAGAGVALADDARESLDKPAREALAVAAKGLILAAVDDPAKACDLAGPQLPDDLRKDFDAIHGASRAKDVRDARNPKLKLAMLKSLVDESAEAQDVQRRLADLAGKLAIELDDLVTRAGKARTDAQALLKDAMDGKYLSPAAVAAGKAGPMGPLLLRIARAAPFLRGEVLADATFDARYRSLERVYEKAPDAQAALLLGMLASLDAKGKAALDAADGKKLASFVEQVKARLDGARDATLDALKAAKDAATSLRQGELSRAVTGVRNADLEFAVKILTAYKKQFNASPALDATEIAGIYFDRNTNRVYFYLDGEDRWVEGAAHAASLAPVIEFLLKSDDRRLGRRVTDPRALAALYHAFGDAVPFETGIEAMRKTAQKVCARARALVAVATKGGATPEQLDRFFAEQAGYDRELAGPQPGLDDDACARRAAERLGRATIEGGTPAAAAIVAELDAALAALENVKLLAFTGVKVEAPTGVAEVSLALRADMLATPPLVAPPRTLVKDGTARCVLVVLGTENPKGAALEAEATTPSGEPCHARLELNTGAALAGGHVEGGALVLRPGTTLVLQGKRGAKVRAGERLLARLHPARAARLKLVHEKDGAGPSVEELGPWTTEGGVIEPTAAWVAGKWNAVAVDEANRPIASAAFEVEKGFGVVCVDAAENRIVFAKAGSKVELRFLESGTLLPEGKAKIALLHASGGIAWASKEPVACPKATLDVPADLPPGRYRVLAQIGSVSLPTWPLAVVTDEPRVTLVRDPFCIEAPTSIGAGERVYARIEPGFSIDPSEVVNAIVLVEALGRGAAARARAMPVPGFPVTALLVPVGLKDKVPPGSWDLLADIYLGAGRLRARGKVQIDPSAEMPFTLQPTDGTERSLYARGDRAEVKLSEAAGISTATFVLVGPDGLGAPVEPDSQGRVMVQVPGDAATGTWELRGTTRQDGTVLIKTVTFAVYAPAKFVVKVKGHVGEQGLVDVPVPSGYKEPVRVRVGAVWTDGNKAIIVPIEGATSVPMVLEDANGRRAEGEARIEVLAAAGPDSSPTAPSAKGPRFAIVANLKERTFFFSSYDSVSRMLREARVPDSWVVVEAGPLSAGAARDWVFAKAPYDGPPATNPLSVYRTQRYWKNLSASVQKAFQAGGCGPETIFDVQNSPVTEDEKTTVAMLAKRILDEKGGWAWDLDRVKVRSNGALAAPAPAKGDEIFFQAVSFSTEAGQVTRIVSPGALGDLALRADLPAKLVLGKPFALAASVAAVPSTIAEGRAYPGGLEKLVGRSLLGATLDGSLDVEGRSIAVTSSASWAKDAPGRELVFDALPSGTEKLEDGSARIAESMTFRASPSGKPASVDLRFEPIPPGTLANVPKRLVVRFRARLSLAVPASELAGAGGAPAEQPAPEATLVLAGTTYAIDPVSSGQLPAPEIEVEAIYVRQSSEGAPAKPNPPPALAPSRLVDKPEALRPIDAAAELAQATSDLASGSSAWAEARARRALHADPSRADAWALVGEALLKAGKAEVAVAPLTRAAALDVASGRPLVLLAEALAASGQLEEARAAAKQALARKVEGDLSERARKIAGE